MTRIYTILVIIALTCFAQVKAEMLEELPSTAINPQGWLFNMLSLQETNFSANLGKNIYPFSQGGWGSTPFTKVRNGKKEIFWVPFEQTAYYYDGILRCGYLLKSQNLIKETQQAISNTIKDASPSGVILAQLSKGEMRRWPHNVFFRAMMREYSNTHNKKILNALINHYKNDTVTYEGRDLCNIENIAWLYRQTNDSFFKDKCLSLLNDNFDKNETLTQYFNSLCSDSFVEIHAVTFHELLKLPAILYSITSDKKYLDIAYAAYAKMDSRNMLPDGVCSGEEGLSGNSSTNCHEMCNVVDYIWSTKYMLEATQDIDFAERMEKALFNAGIGGITKNFDAHQYYSAPNQIYCDNHSSNVSVYDDSRMAYRQVHRPQCCTGNINRLLPIYIESQWMIGTDNTVYKMLYGPGSVNLNVNKKQFTITEKSTYPFGDTINLIIDKGKGLLSMNIRIPKWATSPKAYYNNVELQGVEPGEYLRIVNKSVRANDTIKLVFPKTAVLKRWNTEAMTLFYGPFLMALPVKSEIKQDTILTPKLQSDRYMGYTMTPTSTWNYILGAKDENDLNVVVHEDYVSENCNPWSMTVSPLTIKIPAYQSKSWNTIYKKVDNTYYEVTPPIPPRGSMIYALNGLKPQAITLEPYGRTSLRVSMFPFWKAGKIPAEVLATDNN